ncbi:hypothetical protein GCM10027073_10540 [Streptomyces chlorus]
MCEGWACRGARDVLHWPYRVGIFATRGDLLGNYGKSVAWAGRMVCVPDRVPDPGSGCGSGRGPDGGPDGGLGWGRIVVRVRPEGGLSCLKGEEYSLLPTDQKRSDCDPI